MAERLNPSEAQRKAMAERIARSVGRIGIAESDYRLADSIIAAANKVSEGAPVGTIARRPDGAFVAVRVSTDYLERCWTYTCTDHVIIDDGWPDASDADSWPVIYDPTKPEQKTYPYAEGDTIVIGPECFQVPSKGAIAWKGVWYFDPDYQLNWFPPGEEPLVPRPDPTAQQERAIRGTVEDALRPNDVELLETDPMEFVRRTQQEPSVYELDRLAMESIRTTAAQQEPKLCSGCYECQAPKRHHTPRVVDRLGVDEQGSRWRGRSGTEYWFNGHRWCDSAGSDGKYEYPQGYEPNMAYPYTEVLPDVG